MTWNRFLTAIRRPSGSLLPHVSEVPAEVLLQPGRWCSVLVLHQEDALFASYGSCRDSRWLTEAEARARALWMNIVSIFGSDGIYWAVLNMDKVREQRVQVVPESA